MKRAARSNPGAELPLSTCQDRTQSLRCCRRPCARHAVAVRNVRGRAQVLLNILADEIHRAHQRCLADAMCDPNQTKQVRFACRHLLCVTAHGEQ